MNIDGLEAGRELDELVAEKVMGWHWISKQWYDGTVKYLLWSYDKGYPSGDDFFERLDGRLTPWDLPSYSTDIAAAWEVVEKLRELPSVGIIIKAYPKWSELRDRPFLHEYVATLPDLDLQAVADTAPLAICRVALKAMCPEEKAGE